jgi:SAM-dependent methyltransferase
VEKADLARSFLEVGADYERYRPGFPSEAVSWFAPGPIHAVLDLGAGTGKLTRLLVGVADDVVAVDPSEKMLQQLTLACPTVDARVGTAEDIPLGDATVDMVTAAQAFHWFDKEVACGEIRRVLRPNGVLVLLWNTPDATCEWDIACGRIMHPHLTGEIPDQNLAPALDPLPGFDQVDSTWFRWRETISRLDYLRRWSTVSAFLVADEPSRKDLLSRMETVLDSHPDCCGRAVLEFPHATQVLVYRRGV